ncbi:MAG: hypothetical protein MK101_11580 [Phycisphaerales bacterium]|nr:hypothetical protein [Phycisphaerales bacterium]
MRILVSSLVLIALLVQSLFVALPGSVIICLGGGHEHANEICDSTPTQAPAPEAQPACCSGCSHEDAWPAPPVDDQHDDTCACTDIELALIDLQFTTSETPPTINASSPAPPWSWTAVDTSSNHQANLRGHPPERALANHAAAHTLAVARTTILRI